MARTCGIDWCDNAHASRGWCVTHYNRWLEHGDPEWEPPIKTAELVAEVDWLREGGMSAPLIADALHSTVSNLARRMNKNGRNDLAAFFQTDLKYSA